MTNNDYTIKNLYNPLSEINIQDWHNFITIKDDIIKKELSFEYIHNIDFDIEEDTKYFIFRKKRNKNFRLYKYLVFTPFITFPIYIESKKDFICQDELICYLISYLRYIDGYRFSKNFKDFIESTYQIDSYIENDNIFKELSSDGMLRLSIGRMVYSDFRMIDKQINLYNTVHLQYIIEQYKNILKEKDHSDMEIEDRLNYYSANKSLMKLIYLNIGLLEHDDFEKF